MRSFLAGLLPLFGRWPRRLAALACLLLAGAAALGQHRPAPSAVSNAPAIRATGAIGPGERAVPVVVSGVDPRTYLHVGDHVDLLAAPSSSGLSTAAATATVLAQGVLVLSVLAPDDGLGRSSAALIVAADRVTALRVATLGDRAVLAVRSAPP